MKRDKSEKYEEMVIRLGRQLASRMMLQNIGQKELAKRIGQSQARRSYYHQRRIYKELRKDDLQDRACSGRGDGH